MKEETKVCVAWLNIEYSVGKAAIYFSFFHMLESGASRDTEWVSSPKLSCLDTIASRTSDYLIQLYTFFLSGAFFERHTHILFFFVSFHAMAGKRRSPPQQARPPRRHEPTEESSEEKPPVLLAAEASSKKWRNWWLRTITTFMMIGAFFTILASGHAWVILMVMAIQTIVYGEVVQIAQVPAKESNMRWYKTMSW